MFEQAAPNGESGRDDKDIYTQIAERYGFVLPPEYRAMEKAGYFDVQNDDTYLWVPENEWMSPADILAYVPSDYHLPGFVPFAFNGARHHWCWWPEVGPAAVVLCPHDCEEGEFDSPSFLGAAYRCMLEYAVYEWDAGDTWANEVRKLSRPRIFSVSPSPLRRGGGYPLVCYVCSCSCLLFGPGDANLPLPSFETVHKIGAQDLSHPRGRTVS